MRELCTWIFPCGAVSGTHGVEEVGLGPQRQQPEAGLQVPCAHAGVELLEERSLE